MAISDENRARLKRLLASSALIIRVRFEDFVERAQSPEVVAEIEAALEAGNPTAAMAIVQAQIETMRPTILETFIDAGKGAAEEAADGGFGSDGGGLSGFAGNPMSRIGIVFDPNNQRAADTVRAETATFIKDISDTQLDATREALANAFERGLGPRATANVIRQSIGLTRYQMGIVDNYEATLRAGSARALSYQLRNQARDAVVGRAASGGTPLNEKQIQSMVAQYRKNFVRMRAETIARTESTRVTSQAREETYRQIAAKLGIGHNRLIRTWNATEDDRTRDWHWSMDGQDASLDQPFVDGLGNQLMFPGDPNAPAETVVNCRCAMTFRIAN